MTRRGRSWQAVAVLTAAVVVVGFWGWLLATWPPDVQPTSAPPRPTPTAEPAPVVEAVIVGDSHFAGSGGVDGAEPVAVRVGERMGWSFETYAVGGTGFIAEGYDGEDPAFSEYTADIVAAEPDVVLIEGGANDVQYGPEGVADAAGSLLGRLRDRLPAETEVYVIGPLFLGDNPAGDPIAQALADAAAEHPRVQHIDPDGWFPGDYNTGPGEFVGPDGIHTNRAGARRLVTRVVSALEQAGAPTG